MTSSILTLFQYEADADNKYRIVVWTNYPYRARENKDKYQPGDEMIGYGQCCRRSIDSVRRTIWI